MDSPLVWVQARSLARSLWCLPVLCAEKSTLKTRSSMADAQHARHIMRRAHSYWLLLLRQYGTRNVRTNERTNAKKPNRKRTDVRCTLRYATVNGRGGERSSSLDAQDLLRNCVYRTPLRLHKQRTQERERGGKKERKEGRREE